MFRAAPVILEPCRPTHPLNDVFLLTLNSPDPHLTSIEKESLSHSVPSCVFVRDTSDR